MSPHPDAFLGVITASTISVRPAVVSGSVVATWRMVRVLSGGVYGSGWWRRTRRLVLMSLVLSSRLMCRRRCLVNALGLLLRTVVRCLRCRLVRLMRRLSRMVR